MNSISKRTLGGGLATLAAGGAAVALLGGGAAAQDPGRTITLKELERGATFKHVRNTRPPTRRANLLGDAIVFTYRLTDAGGTAVGREHVACTTTRGARNFLRSTMTCQGVLALRDGHLMLEAITKPGVATTRGAVTGGTGAYSNARGTFVSEEGRSGSTLTITLVG